MLLGGCYGLADGIGGGGGGKLCSEPAEVDGRSSGHEGNCEVEYRNV